MHYNWDIARDINVFEENVIPYLRNPIRRGENPAATPSALADWGYMVTNPDKLTPLGKATRDMEISWSDSVLLVLSKRNASWQETTIKPLVVIAKYLAQLITDNHQNLYITKADLTKLMEIKDYNEINHEFCENVLVQENRFSTHALKVFKYYDIWFNALGETSLFFKGKENNTTVMYFNRSAHSIAFIEEIARLGDRISICPTKDCRDAYYSYQGSLTNGIVEILPLFKNTVCAAHICPTLCTLNIKRNIISAEDIILQQIYYGAPGTGKSHAINRDTKGHKTFRTTFHPDSDYSTFVGAYKPVIEEVETRVVPIVFNNGASFDQNNGTLKEKKISYKFIKQAFLKAYIAAWRNFAKAGNVILTSQEPSPISLSYDKQTWIVTEVTDDKVLYTKEDITTVEDYKKSIIAYWPTMHDPDENGKFKIGTFDHYQAAGCTWYRGKYGKDHSAEDCWLTIYKVLIAGGTIEATPNSQTYYISLRNGEIVVVTRDNKATRTAIKRNYENSEKESSVQKQIAKKLREFDEHNFDQAWETLRETVNGMEIPESTNTDETPPVFLIIEEINRGNCAQIFGDLFQLLDRKSGFSQYPIQTDEDIRRCLISEHTIEDPSFGTNGLAFNDEQERYINNILECGDDMADKIAHGEVLVLPPNLFIWATMNTSDQSLFPMDSAFKRRWEWKYVPTKVTPDDPKDKAANTTIFVKDLNNGDNVLINDGFKNKTIDFGDHDYLWSDFLRAINKRIREATKNDDKLLGFWFVKGDKDGHISLSTFVSKVIFYLWNDIFKEYGPRESNPFTIIARDDNNQPYKTILSFNQFFDEITGDINIGVVHTFMGNIGLIPEVNEEIKKDQDNKQKTESELNNQ